MAFSEIGAKASADYQGDAIGLAATPEGASLRTGFQKLSGQVTEEGLWLESTEGEADGLRLAAAAVGRAGSQLQQLPTKGVVALADPKVTWTRPGMVEEYSVSVDGVRQDFVLAEAPAGSGELSVELALRGARAEAMADGARLVLAKSGRELAYTRLRVTDATGRELPARLDVLASDRLAVRVDDTQVAYPVRIDPTFSDVDWVSMSPGLPGVNGIVRSMAVGANGVLYIGGAFTTAGGVSANRIAKWDGSVWSGLGSGMNNQVYSLAVSGDDLYAGGTFTTAGGGAANRIARWDGIAWSALGSGLDNVVRAMSIVGTDLFVAGAFTTAGGLPANRIARWNGGTWFSLGSGMNNEVYALAAVGSDLYAGGKFTTAGGVTANRIAKWNGSTWSTLSTGMSSSVSALAASGDILYAGGTFTTAGGIAANRVAKWSGGIWSALGSGTNNEVRALTLIGGNLYAGGTFSSAGGVNSYIAKWDNTTWSSVSHLSTSGFPLSITPSVETFAVVGNDLYAGGNFSYSNGVSAFRIAKWNGSTWSSLGKGINGRVRCFAVAGGELYVGGSFNRIGELSANGIAKWDGSAWLSFDSGVNGSVYAIALIGNDLYVGGAFSTAGGVAAKRIAKWNGYEWSGLGAGFDIAYDSQISYIPVVNALAVIGSDLYAGGRFEREIAGGKTVNYIARWNGSNWTGLGEGLNDEVKALAVKGGDLYVGGVFSRAGGLLTGAIARWDGTEWSSLGGGVSDVRALVVCGDDLFAGGYFSNSIGVGKWDGRSWSTIGSWISGGVYSLATNGIDIYAGGSFTNAGGVPASRIAKWNGGEWSALGSGISGSNETDQFSQVDAMLVSANNLYVGGEFTTAGTKTSPYVAMAFIGLPPVISSAASATAVAGQPFSYQITASNSPTYYGASGLPVGLSVDTSSGLISGTPAAAGTFSITLTATNAGGTGTQSLTLTVNEDSNEAIGSWRQQHFGTAENSGNASDLAAPDGDGIANLIKYALLMTPGQDGSNQLPRAVLQGGRLGITFQRSPSRADATIIVEAQSGLDGAWTEIARSSAGGAFTGPADVTETEAGSGSLNVTVHDLSNTADCRYMRVRVNR